MGTVAYSKCQAKLPCVTTVKDRVVMMQRANMSAVQVLRSNCTREAN